MNENPFDDSRPDGRPAELKPLVGGRRRALQVLGGALALPVLARFGTDDAMAAGHALHSALDMGDRAYIFRTLDAHQRSVVTAIVDQIIPDTDTPGAVAAGVHEFIDLILTEFVSEDERASFLEGVRELDQRCRADHGASFDACAPAQQLAVLKALQDEAAELPLPPGSRGRPGNPDAFIYQIKHATLWGYYTSEIGLLQEAQFNPIPGPPAGCTMPSGTAS